MIGLLLSLSFITGVASANPQSETAQELRGIWITRWTYASADQVREIMDEVAGAGFNTVYFQVRGQHDAFYASDLEPWAKELTGTLGQDPGWDPLAVAVQAGHERGLLVHAYLNAFPMWRGEAPPSESTPTHAWHSDPDWVVADMDGMPMALNEGYIYASPGNPAVRERLAAVAADIDKRYEVDGIHLDHIRYPDAHFGRDLVAMSQWEKDGRPHFGDWRRAQVTKTVAAVQHAVSVPVTAAVWGVFTNRWGWPEVSEGRNVYFQDAEAFTRTGAVDALIPMIYWPVNPDGRLDFMALAKDHVSRANGRHVYAGVRADSQTGVEPLIRTIKAAREAGANGVVVFEYTEARAWFGELRERVFQHPAVPPEMAWR
jgi:uncharacterized lipoprotein YddW (UPF0748 family)